MKTKREGLTAKEHFLSRWEFILAKRPVRPERECQMWLTTSKKYISKAFGVRFQTNY